MLGYIDSLVFSGAVAYWLSMRTHNTEGCQFDSFICQNKNSSVVKSAL